jgi:transposase
MALSDDLRKRVVEAVVLGGQSRNTAARRFGVSIASAVRWVTRYKTAGQISPSPSGGDRRSGRIEAQREYLLGLIRRTPDLTLLEIQERLIQNCGERFSVSVLWRFFDRNGVTFKKRSRTPRSSGALTFCSSAGTGSPPNSILIPRNSSSSTQIVHDDDIALREGGNQTFFHPFLEQGCVHRPVVDPRHCRFSRPDRGAAVARNERAWLRWRLYRGGLSRILCVRP